MSTFEVLILVFVGFFAFFVTCVRVCFTTKSGSVFYVSAFLVLLSESIALDLLKRILTRLAGE